MDEIIKLAAELGARIAADARAEAYAAAVTAVNADPDARQLIEAFQTQAQKMAELEAAGKPIEPEDKRQLLTFQQKIAGHNTLKALQKAEVDYLQLMNHVQQAMERPISERIGGADSDA